MVEIAPAPERNPEVIEEVRDGQRLAAIDGIPLHEGDLPGVLVESTRHTNSGDVVLTVWGTSRMFEIRAVAGTEVTTVGAL